MVVGVTGHRVLAEARRLEDAVARVASRMRAAFPGEWTVVSGLAEGADRLVARCLLASGARLVAVLPLPREIYETDFADAVSREEFGDLLRRADEVVQVAARPGGRTAAYEAAGLAVLDRCDVLIAVWDGQDAHGQGGTGDIVTQARRRGLPVAWIHAGNSRHGTLQPVSLGAEQGAVTFERFPCGPVTGGPEAGGPQAGGPQAGG